VNTNKVYEIKNIKLERMETIKKKTKCLHDKQKMKEEQTMLKRLLIGLMCVGFMALLTTESNAGWPTYAGGGVGWGTVDCLSLWKGFGNPEKNPAAISCDVYPVFVLAKCENPGGNTGGGIVFDVDDATITESVVVQPGDLTAKGKVESTIEITDLELYTGLDMSQYDEDCDEFNNGSSEWVVAQDEIHVAQLYVAFRAYVDLDGDGEVIDETGAIDPGDLPAVENVHLACEVDDLSVFDQYETGLYNCTTLCDQSKNEPCTIDNLYDYDFPFSVYE
jgi:hypothetical protein